MAKLSAHGRTELIRLELDEDPARKRGPTDDTLTRRTTYAVMSDGRILVKCKWTAPGYGAPNHLYPDRYDSGPLQTGWTVHGKFKAPVEVSRERWIQVKLAQGFEVVGSPTIPVPPPLPPKAPEVTT